MFRREAIEHARGSRHGSVLLARPMSYSYLTLLFVTFGVCLVTFFVFFSYTRKAHVSGILLPAQGVIRVLSAQPGVVTERRAHEGQGVNAGDILFVLKSEHSTANTANVEQTLASLLQARRESFSDEQKQLSVRADQHPAIAERQVNDLRDALGRIEEQMLLQQRRIALAEAALRRYTDLQESKLVSTAQVAEKEVDLLDQRQRLADLQRAKAAGENELIAAQTNWHDVQLQARRDQQASRRNMLALEQDLAENEAKREIVVRAPQTGTLTAITAELGQWTSNNQPLASILPASSELEAELYVPSRSIGFVERGVEVSLRYEAYSYQRFGQARGLVREVSSTAMRPEELASGANITKGAASEPLYRVRVKLDRQTVKANGLERPLKSGMVLDASVLLERRRLDEWIVEPLYAVNGRL